MTRKILGLLLILFTMLLFIQPIHARDRDKEINFKDLTWYNSSGTVVTFAPTSATITSQAIDLDRENLNLSLQIAVTGTGKANIDYIVSNDDTTWSSPIDTSGTDATDLIDDLVTSLTKTTTADGTPGQIFIPFTAPPCKSIKIRIIEQGVAAVTPTSKLAVQ